MTDRKRHGDIAGEDWEIDGIGEKARKAAEQAAAESKMALGVWLAETVLRATQEGVGGNAAPGMRKDSKPEPESR